MLRGLFVVMLVAALGGAWTALPDPAFAQSKVTPNSPRSGTPKAPDQAPSQNEPQFQLEPEAEDDSTIVSAPQNQERDLITGPGLARILEELGIDTQISTDDWGDPYIEAYFGDYYFWIITYDCEGEDRNRACGSLLFQVAYAVDGGINTDIVNDWNYASRWTRAYMDDEFDPVLEMDIALYGGLSETAIAERVRLWLESLEEFNAFFF